jgi:nucleotide-binding universal stress UspA family protein
MTKQITVGYDGSAPSFEAVLWAAAEADVRGASLRIVSCFEVPFSGEAIGGWAATEAYGSLVEASKIALAAIKDVVADATPAVEVVTEASTEPASYVLVHGADADDLIVVGASSHKGAAAFWLGSTPRHVVRHSPCPVVVVRGAASRGRPDRVVVGIDGSAASDRALLWACNEADLHQVNLVIAHGWLYPYLPVDMTSSQARDLTNVDAACVLERAVEFARERFAGEIVGQLVEKGPATALLEIVRDGDLLVIGSRGRGALAANLFGSTVNTVLDRSAVPVAVVRGADEEE